MSRVMLGWVKSKGRVSTEAMGMNESGVGSEMVKGNGGVVRLIVSGNGSIAVARAFKESSCSAVVILNDNRVTS